MIPLMDNEKQDWLYEVGDRLGPHAPPQPVIKRRIEDADTGALLYLTKVRIERKHVESDGNPTGVSETLTIVDDVPKNELENKFPKPNAEAKAPDSATDIPPKPTQIHRDELPPEYRD